MDLSKLDQIIREARVVRAVADNPCIDDLAWHNEQRLDPLIVDALTEIRRLLDESNRRSEELLRRTAR